MYDKILDYLEKKPSLYEISSAPFWDDEHISKEMLKAHLAPSVEAASRKHDFIVSSVQWIKEIAPKNSGSMLLDLGCGPGIYAELFHEAGFCVTGIDFSKRSVEYARNSADSKNMEINYLYKNYLDIEYENAFDVITLIYCDLGVLPPNDRKKLLLKIKKALKPGGILILDAFTQAETKDFKEGSTVECCIGGFWNSKRYMCIKNNYLYKETDNCLEQYIVVTDEECQCYNIWNQLFTCESLKKELNDAYFESVQFYDNAAGKALTESCNTICAVAK